MILLKIVAISNLVLQIFNLIFLSQSYPGLSITLSLISLIISVAAAGVVAAGAGAAGVVVAGVVVAGVVVAVAGVVAGVVAFAGVVAGDLENDEESVEKYKTCKLCKGEGRIKEGGKNED